MVFILSRSTAFFCFDVMFFHCILKSPRDNMHPTRSKVREGKNSMFLTIICTRPNISYTISIVSRYMDYLRKIHWQAMKWILQYLRGTTHVDLVMIKAVTFLRIALWPSHNVRDVGHNARDASHNAYKIQHME